MAFIFGNADRLQHWMYGKRKQELFADLPDTIVEIGAGSGVNFRYLKAGTQLEAVEPNRYFHPGIERQGKQAGINVNLQACSAEQLPYSDAELDCIICTLVLCSVTQPATVLDELSRCLKPGGKLVLMEHVAAPKSKGKRMLQKCLTPLWRLLFDGCRLNRELEPALESAGFEVSSLKHFSLFRNSIVNAMLPFSPHVSGMAIKR